MKPVTWKGWVVVLLAVLLALGLVVWKVQSGGQNSPTANEAKRIPLAVVFSSLASQDLPPRDPRWEKIPGKTLDLVPQVMFIPWGSPGERKVVVQVMQDEKKLAFRLSWEDATRNQHLVRKGEFPDGAAIMFPIKEKSPASIMMGFLKPVNIWHWKAARRQATITKNYANYHVPFEKGTLLATHRAEVDAPKPGSEIIDNLAVMPGTLTPKKVQSVSGHAVWRNGRWFVTFSRDLTTFRPEEDSQFHAGEEIWVAFALWDGARRERGPRKAITDWVSLSLASSPGQARQAASERDSLSRRTGIFGYQVPSRLFPEGEKG